MDETGVYRCTTEIWGDTIEGSVQADELQAERDQFRFEGLSGYVLQLFDSAGQK